jgi:hypothetical protein
MTIDIVLRCRCGASILLGTQRAIVETSADEDEHPCYRIDDEWPMPRDWVSDGEEAWCGWCSSHPMFAKLRATIKDTHS